MRTFPNDDLVRLLSDEQSNIRMLALHFLSEGYAEHGEVLSQVFSGWDRWGIEAAFTEFPLLSHISIPPQQIEECCQRAAAMVPGRKLVDPIARCAGKLLEQVVRLKVSDLVAHQASIAEVASQSKIFFRVDPVALRHRIESLELDADTLSERLENAVERLSRQSDDAAAFHAGLHALEALRIQHPETLDLAAGIAHPPPNDGPRAASFQLLMHSLLHLEQAGTEANLAGLLIDHRESIHANAMEALVRLGTPLAAAYLVAQFETADSAAQRWIARGLQRIRGVGLAEEIGKLRAATEDPNLWLMLLIAEVRQLDPASAPRIADDADRIETYSHGLTDALKVFIRMHQQDADQTASP